MESHGVRGVVSARLVRRLCFFGIAVFVHGTIAHACDLRARSVAGGAPPLPPSEAATATSTARFTLSSRGAFSVVRQLTSAVPAEAVSCTVVLEGKFTRRGGLSNLQTLATRSSTAQRVSFTASRLPSVRSERERNGTVLNPALHVRVRTQCVNSNSVTVLEDVSPVVARYADCGFSTRRVSMSTFVSNLKRKLALPQ